MTYKELKGYMTKFLRGEMTKRELAFAIGLWQRGGAKR